MASSAAWSGTRPTLVAMAGVVEELHTAVGGLETVLAAGERPVRLDGESGDLIISPLTAEDVPAEAISLKADTPELKRNLIAVLLAHSTNLGLTRMAEACGISYDILSWTDEWYVREETLRAANLVLVDYHQRLPLTSVFGAGTLSSSDGQRFPTRGKSTTARPMSRYFAHEGMIRARQLTDQTEQAWCLTLAANAVIAWTTECYGLAVEQMRRSGQRIDDEALAHISPAHSANINFVGAIEVDIEGELAALGPTGYRPLRGRDTLF